MVSGTQLLGNVNVNTKYIQIKRLELFSRKTEICKQDLHRNYPQLQGVGASSGLRQARTQAKFDNFDKISWNCILLNVLCVLTTSLLFRIVS